MGGGEDLPSRNGSKEKEIVVCVLPWPEEAAKRGIDDLKKEYKDTEMHYYISSKMHPVDVPEGMSLFLYHCGSLKMWRWCHTLTSSSFTCLIHTIKQQHLRVLRSPPTRLLPGNHLLAPIICLSDSECKSHPVLLRRDQPCCQTSNLHGLQDSIVLRKRCPWTADCRVGRYDGSGAES